MAFTPVSTLLPHFHTDNGTPLAGGTLELYEAGTTTPAEFFTAAGATLGTSESLDARGEPAADLYIDSAGIYKFRLLDASSVLIREWDNVAPTISANGTIEWLSPKTATFVDTDTFTIEGNPQNDAGETVYHVGRRVRVFRQTNNDHLYATIDSSSYGAATDTTTVSLTGITDSTGAPATLNNESMTAWVGLASAANPSVPAPTVFLTKAALKATWPGPIAYMAGRSSVGDGGEGHFRWVSGDQSANVTNDAQEGIWVAPDSGATGASGAWQRQFQDIIYATWFGASDNSNNTTALQAAIDYAAVLGSSRNNITVKTGVLRSTLDPITHKGRVMVDISGNQITCTQFDAWRLQNHTTVIGQKATVVVQASPSVDAGFIFGADNTLASVQTQILGYPRCFNVDGVVAGKVTYAVNARSFRKSHIEVEFENLLVGVLLSNVDDVGSFYNEIHVKGVGDESVSGSRGVLIREEANGSYIYCHELRKFEVGVDILDTSATTIYPIYIEGTSVDGVKVGAGAGSAVGTTIIGGAIEGSTSGVTGFGVNAAGTADGVTIIGTIFGRGYNSTTARINIGGNAKNISYVGAPLDAWSLHSYGRSLSLIPRGAGHLFGGAYGWDYTEIEENDSNLALPSGAYLIWLTTDGTANTISLITGDVINSRRVRVVFGDGNTTLQHGTNADNLHLQGATNVTPSQYSVIELERIGVSTRWFEVFRSIK